jgi:hypothetical protein
MVLGVTFAICDRVILRLDRVIYWLGHKSGGGYRIWVTALMTRLWKVDGQ